VQRLAELEGLLAGQQHERDVGLDDTDRATRVSTAGITNAAHQRGDHSILVGQRDLAWRRPASTRQHLVHVVLGVGQHLRISAPWSTLCPQP